MAKVSIIIPIYNAEEYLRECLDSAVEQTLQEIEIILVNDGSTDTSREICEEYAKKDVRIKLINKENGGVCDARNVGMRAVTSKYFTFLESDDWLPLDACEKMCMKQEEYDADFVLGSYYKVSQDNVKIKHPLGEKEIFFDENKIKTCLLEYIMGLTGARLKKPENVDSLLTDTAKLYKTEIVLKNNLYWISRKEIYSDCLDYILRYANCCKKAVFFDEPLYYYRRTNTGSQTAGYRKQTVELWMIQFEAMKKFIQENKLEHLLPAFYSRVCFSIIPIGGNAYRTGNRKEGMKEIKQALQQDIYRIAFKNFKIRRLPIYFRPLFIFAKYRMYNAFYYMTVVMRKIMNRERGI